MDIKKYRDKQDAPKSRMTRLMKDAMKQITELKAKHRGILSQQRAIASDRDTYFRAVSENQKLRKTHKRTSSHGG